MLILHGNLMEQWKIILVIFRPLVKSKFKNLYPFQKFTNIEAINFSVASALIHRSPSKIFLLPNYLRCRLMDCLTIEFPAELRYDSRSVRLQCDFSLTRQISEIPLNITLYEIHLILKTIWNRNQYLDRKLFS